MRLHGGVGAFEFDGLLDAGDGIDGAAKNVGFGVAVDVAGGLLHFDDLGLSLKTVEEKDAGIFGQAQSGSDLGKLRFLEFAVMLDFLVELHGFGDGCPGGAILFVFLGGGPVDERCRGVPPTRRVRR